MLEQIMQDSGSAPRRETCRQGKITYRDRKKARKAQKILTARYGLPLDVYRCPFCPGFHVGNQALGRKSEFE